MVAKQVKVIGEVLRSKQAGNFVELTSGFKSSVYLEVDNKRINGKSIIGVLSLNLFEGDEVNVLVNGEDEIEAMEAIENYIC